MAPPLDAKKPKQEAAVQAKPGCAPGIPPNGRKVLIISADMVEDTELTYPYYRLQAEGYEVHLATPEAKVITGKHGVPMRGDLDIAKVSMKGYDALVIPGGQSPDQLRRTDTAAKLVAQALRQGCWVAALCHGPQLLGSIPRELRGDRVVTSWISVRDEMLNAGYDWVDEPVVVDNGVITSRNPQDLPVFVEVLIAALYGELDDDAEMEEVPQEAPRGAQATGQTKSKSKAGANGQSNATRKKQPARA
ncbi:MAG TPA: type 1 glutamine amidotransferase domain-containing protein [bacterium]|nr:type 1 glutamine amidotransferase domain-containing protein [bacterium]